MKKLAVIGAGFGDEGKGLVTDWLCSRSKNPAVVRYCGGHQAGHQVVLDNERHHVFANFGSGTLRGIPTYISSFCTVDPEGMWTEYAKLIGMGITPVFFIAKDCPITTPYDKYANISDGETIKHGTCGVGVNATYRREENHYHLLFEDLQFPDILKMKLELIKSYYNLESPPAIDYFISLCRLLVKTQSQCVEKKLKTVIFEGSQGLLLDQNFGFFPYVTPSNTGTENILELASDIDEIYLVTRAYQTRHGNGPMMNEDLPHNIKDNPWEKNFDEGHQGKFRKALLNLDALEYVINKDEYVRSNPDKLNLVITCLDLIDDEYRLTYRNQLILSSTEYEFVETIQDILGINNIYLSHSPIGSNIVKFKR